MHISTIIPSQRTTRKIPGTPGYLYEEHRRELEEESAISPDVIAERGYQSVARPTNTNQEPRLMLQRLGFPSWAIREDYYFPGLWLPSYSPRGDLLPGQWKPRTPVANRDGKRMKYASARSAVRLDVHPRWSADRGQDDPTKVPAIQDPDIPLWITEGIKKGDSLTSRGICTVALSGVYNWRNTHATLGDWEDVRLKGREVTICFDADAITKPAVLRAMERLGKWLRSKGVAKVWYLVVPAEVNGHGVKGVDDYFAAGGTVKALEQAAMDRPPRVPDTSDAFTDARLAETLAEEVLDGAYVWAAGLDWLQWDGRKWQECHEVTVIESVRTWALARFAEAASDLQRDREGAAARVDGWRAMLGASRQRAVLNLARGIVERRADEFDADPYLLNTPGGVVDLRTGDILPHDPDLMCTKITSGNYIPGYTHPDWQTALQALPEEVAEWYQVRVGQALTGQTTPDGVLPILQGGGENGKSLLMTDGVLPAIGGYGSVASPKLFMSTKNEHSTERAELRGQRLVVAEELAEGRSIDVTALKQIMDVGRIKARRTHKDNMEFDASHSLFATTNYIPVVSETDHGTWRRLALVRFPFTYVKKDV
ncbi:MAG TPA: phage/plasmid primase, P4 family, partial [Armatimonadota bacterium]|nr:phage/plasmid primase, P4 family [Armatimonadota bacterium]